MGLVDDKKGEIVEFIDNLKEILPDNYEIYKSNMEKRLACEKAFEKIIEAVNDLAILTIKNKRLSLLTDKEKAFDILSKSGDISEELASKLKQAKGMRNILAHQYDKLDDEIIFEVIHNEIIKDTEIFLEIIEND